MLLKAIFSAVFLIAGLACVIANLVQRKRANEAKTWPTVAGVVTSSGLQEQRSYDSESGTSISYKPVVTYTYTLMGQTFTGEQLSFGNMNYDRGTAAKKIAPYPQGAQVLVHYDPDNPLNAVLETKAAGSILFLIIGILFMFIGVLAVFFLPAM
jgi:hypothetical protein